MKNVSAGIASVTDKRSENPTAYWRHQNDTGCYDRPVADLVREAMNAECQRAGFLMTSAGSATWAVSCEVLDYKASATEPGLFSPGTLNLSVVIAFEWRNSQTGQVLSRNERSEHRNRKLEDQVPVMPFGLPVIKDYGQELLNDLLPQVIEKELQSFSETTAISSNAQPYRVVSYRYDDKTQRGTLSVDIAGHGIEARDWVIKNIGKICSSKELLNEAGQEKAVGGHYRVLNESVKDNILTIEFSAGYDSQ